MKIHDQYDTSAPFDGNVEYGMANAYTLVQALQAAGKNLTRQGLVDAINNERRQAGWAPASSRSATRPPTTAATAARRWADQERRDRAVRRAADDHAGRRQPITPVHRYAAGAAGERNPDELSLRARVCGTSAARFRTRAEAAGSGASAATASLARTSALTRSGRTRGFASPSARRASAALRSSIAARSGPSRAAACVSCERRRRIQRRYREPWQVPADDSFDTPQIAGGAPSSARCGRPRSPGGRAPWRAEARSATRAGRHAPRGAQRCVTRGPAVAAPGATRVKRDARAATQRPGDLATAGAPGRHRWPGVTGT